MAFRTQETSCVAVLAYLTLATSLFAQSELKFEVRHDHAIRSCSGTLLMTDQGVVYQQVEQGRQPKDLHRWQWNYQDVRQLWLSPEKVLLTTYEDRTLLLGRDKSFEFTIMQPETFTSAYELLRERLDQRFVATVADDDVRPIWQVAVKLDGRIHGSEGVLLVGRDRVVFKTPERGKSRVWRIADIENVSTSGPFQLSITTYERAVFHYGNLRAFNFQLKNPLSELAYDELWKELNAAKGLKFLAD